MEPTRRDRTTTLAPGSFSGPGPGSPSPRAAPPQVDADLATALAGASGTAEVAAALVAATAPLGRATAVALVEPVDGRDAVVVAASSGFPCSTMDRGAVLPLDAGLPLTEACRTGRAVVVPPTGPSRWVAVPLEGVRGALLLCDPHAENDVAAHAATGGHLRPVAGWRPDDTAALAAAARLAGAGLRRGRTEDRRSATLLGLAASLRPCSTTGAAALPGLAAAWRLEPRERALGLGGDVALAVSDGRGGGWLLLADACGHGATAAAAAAALRAGAIALAGVAPGPAALLTGLDAVAAAGGEPGLATALAVHCTPGAAGLRLRIAAAGHPLPLVRHVDGSVGVLGEPALLLGVEPGADRPEAAAVLRPGELLVLHSDGLVDVPTTGAGEAALVEALREADPAGPLSATVAGVVGALLGGGATPPDDVAILVAASA